MLLVGLTGGLGTGKSTVARMLSERGAVVVDADDLARRALDPGTPAFDQVRERFGDELLTAEGAIDRGALAQQVFADEDKRRALESITHPAVFQTLMETVEARRSSDDVVVFDAPLIVETGFQEACDVLVVVTAPVEQQVERVTRDRGMDEGEARARIAVQSSSKEREAVADVVIRNDGDLQSLEQQADALWKELLSRAARRG